MIKLLLILIPVLILFNIFSACVAVTQLNTFDVLVSAGLAIVWLILLVMWLHLFKIENSMKKQ